MSAHKPESEPAGAGESLRLDKWLWYARLCKTRTLAARLCDIGRIRVNGAVVGKAHHPIRKGDVVTFVWNGRVRVLRIAALGARRGPASEARALYTDVEAPAEPHAQTARDPAEAGAEALY